jgi:hypothetical protein
MPRVRHDFASFAEGLTPEQLTVVPEEDRGTARELVER